MVVTAVFSLPCRSCGEPVDIPGRYGFKLKNAGISASLCNNCRRGGFLQARQDGLSAADAADVKPATRRMIPVLAIVLLALITTVGLWLQRGAGAPPAGGQDAVTGLDSPSR